MDVIAERKKSSFILICFVDRKIPRKKSSSHKCNGPFFGRFIFITPCFLVSKIFYFSRVNSQSHKSSKICFHDFESFRFFVSVCLCGLVFASFLSFRVFLFKTQGTKTYLVNNQSTQVLHFIIIQVLYFDFISWLHFLALMK